MITKVYIAFSIHETNDFMVATNTLNVGKLPEGFTLGRSRRPGYNAATDGVKLNWVGLNRQDGTPHTDVVWVKRRFNELERMGWIIVKRLEKQ